MQAAMESKSSGAVGAVGSDEETVSGAWLTVAAGGSVFCGGGGVSDLGFFSKPGSILDK